MVVGYNWVMVTIDLNSRQKWSALFKRVEKGESLRVVRGRKQIALVQPADVIKADEAFLNTLAKMGAKQIAETFPPNEYADWEKGHGSR
jgi:hypothetical protein